MKPARAPEANTALNRFVYFALQFFFFFVGVPKTYHDTSCRGSKMLCGTNVFFTFVELLFCFFLFSYFLILSLRFFFFFFCSPLTQTNKKQTCSISSLSRGKESKVVRPTLFHSRAPWRHLKACFLIIEGGKKRELSNIC